MRTCLATTVIGSHPVPEWLKLHPTEETLVDAMTVVMRAQEAAGIEVISDGELGRWDLARGAGLPPRLGAVATAVGSGGMVERFVHRMAGVEAYPTRTQLLEFRRQPESSYRRNPAGVVTGPLGEGALDLPRDWDLARRLTGRPLKVTVTSPYLMAKTVVNAYYAGFEELVMAFAGVLAGQLDGIDAAVIQVDEPNVVGAPQDSLLAARAINRVFEKVRGEKAVHLCFGNYEGQTLQQGDYAQLLAMLSALECDHVLLETTRRPMAEIESLRDVTRRLRFGVGVIDVKDLQIESAERVAQRIEALARTLGEERLAYVHPDCGLRMLPRTVADGKLRALVAGRDLYLGSKATAT